MNLEPLLASSGPREHSGVSRGSESAFTGRRVLLISPQAWNGLTLSKHHYAIELAKHGSEVFFLNPPSTSGFRPRISPGPHASLWIVDYSQLSRGRRFLPQSFNYAIEAAQAKILQRALGARLDVVWSFDPARFTSLNQFDAMLHLFHAVDRVPPDAVERIAASADAVISVSDLILDDFEPSGVPRFFVNHGLTEDYARLARQRLASLAYGMMDRPSAPYRAGYVGNLLHPAIDHSTFSCIIQENADIEFHFWGPSDYAALAWKHPGVPEVREFVSFLGRRKNVFLHGLMPPAEIAPRLTNMHLFLTCYDPAAELNRGSNNHKLLEYLSTGKPVVTNHVSTYVRDGIPGGLLCMPKTLDNRGLPALFQHVIGRLGALSSTEQQQHRLQFALANTYADQLRSIDSIAASLPR